ncbi:MAG TPA: glycerophosphodiester phosphodiesterase [Anaerolineales bacterium]|nr:glycerophosphodiester phosphodiesterase [Anaerolineales bacterium]HNB35412.1 glycerophosphodiester phosphodiesterase [Anaerolineales bacterium]HNC07854.1 glycerophosphodiester phosphodiesterase [Anaerolineales bacterium]
MKFKTWQIASLVLLVIIAILRFTSKPIPPHPYYSGIQTRPLVIAHQGGDGLWPGETMFAYQSAVDLGVDVLEMDIHITKDGVLVLMHDETVDRTTDGTGEIESMTLEELKKLDAGYDWSPDDGVTFPYRGSGLTVATLEEVFTAFPNMHMTIEIKKTNTSMAEPFCQLIREYHMQDKVLVASFHDERLKEFRAECPEVATSSAKNETTIFVLMTKGFLSGFYSPVFHSLQVPEESGGITVMTESFVKASHARNLAVEPWTINDEETMRKFIAWGVDGIITDRPDIMMEVLGR